MKLWTKAICLVTSTLALTNPTSPRGYAETNEKNSSQENRSQTDQVVSIDPETKFLKMTAAEREQAYKELDQIELTSQEIKPVPKYSQVKEILSAEDYQKLIDQSKDNPLIIYLGFNECPYCRAFLPKFNHLAKEFGAEINYYNTSERAKDDNFEQVVSFFNVETVPHAFIVKQGKVVKQINNNNSMAEIEAFLHSYQDLKS